METIYELFVKLDIDLEVFKENIPILMEFHDRY